MKLFFVTFFILFLTLNCVSADELGFENKSDEIVRKLTNSEKTIKSFFKTATTKEAKKIEVFYEYDGKVLHNENYILSEEKKFVNLMIHFQIDSTEIDKSSYIVIDELARALSSSKLIGAKISINGHTDSRGDSDHNKILSLQRALSVKKFLVDTHKISSQRLFVQGFGDQLPITDNQTSEGRKLNRRVEIELLN